MTEERKEVPEVLREKRQSCHDAMKSFETRQRRVEAFAAAAITGLVRNRAFYSRWMAERVAREALDVAFATARLLEIADWSAGRPVECPHGVMCFRGSFCSACAEEGGPGTPEALPISFPTDPEFRGG